MAERSDIRPGAVWITGLSCCGKTTVAEELRGLFVQRGVVPVVIDGDRMRAILPRGDRFTAAARLELAGVFGRLARDFVLQDHVVICATMGLFHRVHEWNRANIPGYLEVLLRAPERELRCRDARRPTDRRVYAGTRVNVVGVDLVAELPRAPDLVIENHDEVTPRAAAERALSAYLGISSHRAA